MGLTLTAYDRATVLPVDFDPKDDDFDRIVFVWDQLMFARAARGLVDADVVHPGDGQTIAQRIYDISGAEQHHWGCSYGGFTFFRDALMQVSGWPYPTVTDLPANWTPDPDLPFMEVVWHSDTDGAIGHLAAADLLADFQQYKDRFAATCTDPDLVEHYDEWMTGLALAARGGFVLFT